MNNIQITVSGVRKSGKSTLVALLIDSLQSEGFNAKLGTLNNGAFTINEREIYNMLDEKIEALRSKISIVINEQDIIE